MTMKAAATSAKCICDGSEERFLHDQISNPLFSRRGLLIMGIVTRIVVVAFLAPLDSDTGHLALVQYVAKHHSAPPLDANPMAFHPPLYYLVSAPIYALTGSVKCVQALSLVLSILTLIVLYRLIYKEELIEGERPRAFAFGLACFLPQFVLYGLFVSNDTLAILVGALLILQVVRYSKSPVSKQQVLLLGVLTGVGLLTKATFLTFLPILFGLVFFVRLQQKVTLVRSLSASFAILLMASALGCYKFVRNYQEAKNPFISNLDKDYDWVVQQKRSYRGVGSYLDVDLWKLLRSPSFSSATAGSYPLLLYGSLWYQHVQESNFAGSSHSPFFYLGSVIYVLGLLPTAFFLVGLVYLFRRLPFFLRDYDSSRKEDRRLLVILSAVFFLFGNLALLFAVSLKSHVWSVWQGRLLFPSFFGMLAPFGIGARVVDESRFGRSLLKFFAISLMVCFFLYFTSEIAYQSLLLLSQHHLVNVKVRFVVHTPWGS